MTFDKFAMIPIEALSDSRLTPTQFKVLCALFSFANKDGECHPKRQQLVDRCNIKMQRISVATTELEKLGWLQKTGKGGFSKSSNYIIKLPDTVTDLVTVTESVTVTDLVTNTVTDLVTRKELTIKHTNIENIKEKKLPTKRKSKNDGLNFVNWKKSLKEDEDAIPKDHFIFRFADESKIPRDFLRIAWLMFSDMFNNRPDHKQLDWAAHFANYVKKGWLDAWRINGNGEYYLTTAGKQVQLRLLNREAQND